MNAVDRLHRLHEVVGSRATPPARNYTDPGTREQLLVHRQCTRTAQFDRMDLCPNE